MEKLTDEQRAMVQEAWTRAKARMALQQIQEAGKQQRQEIERARMTRRTIDETGRDISEPQPQPELIQPGWYWTGRFCVWVVGPSQRGQWVHYQTAMGCRWAASRKTSNWRRVHEAVQESGQGFGWRPDRSD
jgi:hypothetical protein